MWNSVAMNNQNIKLETSKRKKGDKSNFSKLMESVWSDWEIFLIQKLEGFGLKGKVLSWFKSYLDNRTQ